jgi:hypothetical protein
MSGKKAVLLLLKQVVHMYQIHCSVDDLKCAYGCSAILSMNVSDMEMEYILGLKGK